MKKISIIFIFQFLFVYSYSQELFSIKGILKCDTVFVKNTTIKLFKDTVPIQATIANENGFFIFEKVEKGIYIVNVISLFYEPVYINVNLLNNSDLGIIKLKESAIMLNEVVIAEKIEPIVLTNDGVVLNVANTLLMNKDNAFDLLNYAPVTFIASDNSQFESGRLEILINGKQVNIPADKQDQFLKSIPAQNIEKIEIVDKPDASIAGNQYGKINIILNQDKGFSGYIEAKLMYYKKFFQSYNGSLFYNSDKLQLYSSFNLDIRQFLFEETGIENRNGLIVDKKSNQSTDCRTPNFIFGTDYQINNKSSIGLLYSLYYENNKQIKSSDKYIFSSDYLENDSLICKESNHNSKDILQTLTLNYLHTTDSLGSNFSTSVDYAPDIKNGNNFYNFSFWQSANDTSPIKIIDYKYKMPYKNSVLSYNARYNHNFKNYSSLNFGTKLIYTNYNNGWDAFNLLNEYYIFDENESKKIIFNEYLAALFSDYKFQYKKSSFSISVRGEYNFNKYKNNNDDDFSTVTNWTILPTFLHNITINSNNRIYYYLTQKIYRPNFYYYMESSRYDPISQNYGNSKLKPQNQYAAALGYILKNKYSFTLQAVKNDNLFLKLPKLSDNQLIYSRINGGLTHSIGLFLNLPIDIFDWWETYNNISGRFVNINFKDKNYISNSIQGSFSHSSYFYLSQKISLLLEYSYNSKSKSFFTEQSDVHNLGTGIGWRNDNFSISFAIFDILNSVATKTKYNYYDIIIGNSTNKQITSRTLWLRLSYNFSVGKKIEDKSIKESGIEEQKGRIH